MKKIVVWISLILFMIVSYPAFARKIKEIDAKAKVKAASIRFEMVEKLAKELAPTEFLAAEAALNNAKKEEKEKEWEYAFQEADKVLAYVFLIEAIIEYKKAERELEEFKKKQ